MVSFVFLKDAQPLIYFYCVYMSFYSVRVCVCVCV